MKQPKKLKRDQKIKLTKLGLDASEYMLLSESDDKNTFEIIHKHNNLKLNIDFTKGKEQLQ